jgi:hypothetical protein
MWMCLSQKNNEKMMMQAITSFLLLTAISTLAGDLSGLVLCGYQGWFRCEGDGSGNGWHHYASGGKFEPGHAHIDLWPDVSEFTPDERFKTPFRHADGSVAEVFSSVKAATVRRHFKWMREYGIDGVFLQRFATSAKNPKMLKPMDQVLGNCREAANAESRKWALMYDMSGTKPEDFPKVADDWKHLHNDGPMKGNDAAYLKCHDKPLVAIWGMGFKDRPNDLAKWEELIRFFKNEGCSVMLGVPCYWRTQGRDCINDAKLLDLIKLADIVSPWNVGRFTKPEQAAARVDSLLKPDFTWCRDHKLGYLPVAFPGFSWQNLQKDRGRDEKSNAIPRLGGKFLWSQAMAVRKAGIDSLYVAMFDEMDEGTAIFKTSDYPPVGESRFISEPGMKSDHYLWLTGEIGKLLRGERKAGEDFPVR